MVAPQNEREASDPGFINVEETVYLAFNIGVTGGLSPHALGKHTLPDEIVALVRTIPTRVGKTR